MILTILLWSWMEVYQHFLWPCFFPLSKLMLNNDIFTWVEGASLIRVCLCTKNKLTLEHVLSSYFDVDDNIFVNIWVDMSSMSTFWRPTVCKEALSIVCLDLRLVWRVFHLFFLFSFFFEINSTRSPLLSTRDGCTGNFISQRILNY